MKAISLNSALTSPSLYLFLHSFFSFFLRTATVYVEPLLLPWSKPAQKKLADPISAEDLLRHWPGLCEKDLALLIEHELNRAHGAAIFAKPYVRVPNTRMVSMVDSTFEEFGYSPNTRYPHVVFKNGRKCFDFSRIFFDKKDLAKFAKRFMSANALLIPPEVVNSTLKIREKKIAAELTAIRNYLAKRDSQILLKYLPIAQALFEQEFEKFPADKMKYKTEEGKPVPSKIKSREFFKKMNFAAPALPQSTCLEFWKLLSPIYKLSGRGGEPE